MTQTHASFAPVGTICLLHDGCFAQTTQLVAKVDMKAAGALRSVISKASNIVSAQN